MSTTTLDLTAESTSRFVDTETFRIHYYEAGEGHPLVLLHGSGPGANGWSNFSQNIPELARHFRVLSIDMPGWGESDTQTDETGYDHVEALIGFLDALGIESAALVGNSMGGTTAVETAVRFPERVSHLVTMGVPIPGKNYFTAGNGPSEGQSILERAYSEPTPENIMNLVRVMCFDPAWATEELATLRSKAALGHPEHLASYLRRPKIRAYHSLGPELQRIDIPTLAVHGRDDRVVHFEHSLRLVSTIPNSRLVLINRCGHWVQIEHAKEFNNLVINFLNYDTALSMDRDESSERKNNTA